MWPFRKKHRYEPLTTPPPKSHYESEPWFDERLWNAYIAQWKPEGRSFRQWMVDEASWISSRRKYAEAQEKEATAARDELLKNLDLLTPTESRAK